MNRVSITRPIKIKHAFKLSIMKLKFETYITRTVKQVQSMIQNKVMILESRNPKIFIKKLTTLYYELHEPQKTIPSEKDISVVFKLDKDRIQVYYSSIKKSYPSQIKIEETKMKF